MSRLKSAAPNDVKPAPTAPPPKFAPGDLVMLRTPKAPVMVASEFVARDSMGEPCACWVVHWSIQGALRRAQLPESALMRAPPEG